MVMYLNVENVGSYEHSIVSYYLNRVTMPLKRYEHHLILHVQPFILQTM